jgi:nucleoside-diphosphate-sugar epimerase
VTRPVVLVTGASGFIGGHLLADLARTHAVRGLYRTPPAAAAPATRIVLAPALTDRGALRQAVAGAAAVVHLAARVHVMRETAADPLAAFRAVNVEGTRALLEEAIAAGVESFVLVSSVKAVGEASGAAPLDEHTPPAPADPYGISKLEAERLVAERAGAAGLHAPVLRLPLVYGPGVGGNMAALLRLVDRGLPLPFGAIRNRRSLAYVGNVTAAIAAALAMPRPAAGAYFVSDGEDPSTPELIRGIGRALGRPARLLPVPPALLRLAGRAGDLLRPRFSAVPIDSAMVDRLLGDLVVDTSRLRREAGFEPPFTLEEGLARTAAWYRAAAPVDE